MSKHTRTIKEEYRRCDFCKTEIEDEVETLAGVPYYQCSHCKKDICEDHLGEGWEGGNLCTECSDKGWRFDYGDPDGVVELRNKETGEVHKGE